MKQEQQTIISNNIDIIINKILTKEVIGCRGCGIKVINVDSYGLCDKCDYDDFMEDLV